MSAPRFRSIRPRVPAIEVSSISTVKNSTPIQNHIGSIRRTPTACKSCQSRRTKCTGGTPCLA
ncbi:hypothetical protein N7492_000875 [Penicillium capsulatum]|uniref:Zn(2)-C6 fungal-type domain-containing protein n=1 Tax=Penicillium capsulatum TaxID=69766 RepID=A0A9W9ISM4_9EURO|nr:hypothetical protein N7492_000875 [Penicillium capsulatum]